MLVRLGTTVGCRTLAEVLTPLLGPPCPQTTTLPSLRRTNCTFAPDATSATPIGVSNPLVSNPLEVMSTAVGLSATPPPTLPQILMWPLFRSTRDDLKP